MKKWSAALLLALLCAPALADPPDCEDCGSGGSGCESVFAFNQDPLPSGPNGVYLKYVGHTCTTVTLDVMIRNWSGAVQPDWLSLMLWLNPVLVRSGYSATGSWFLPPTGHPNLSYVEVRNSPDPNTPPNNTQVLAHRAHCDYFCDAPPVSPFTGDKKVTRITWTLNGPPPPGTTSHRIYTDALDSAPVAYQDLAQPCWCTLVAWPPVVPSWTRTGWIVINNF